MTHADGRPYGAPPIDRTPIPAVAYEVRQALVGLGLKQSEAARAVGIAATHVGRDPTVEDLLRAALRACARPHA